MDIIHSFLNLVAPPFTFVALFLLLPPFHFFKFFLSTFWSILSENVTGKRLSSSPALPPASGSMWPRALGAPDVRVVPADVSKLEDCKRIVDEAANHFGRVDHLVNNAGIQSASTLEEATDITNFRPVMDVNFWGSVYTTRFAIPHLRNSHGKIIGMASSAAWLPMPRMSIYNASKAALISFYDTLRIELGSDIGGITVVTPGFIESEMTQGEFLKNEDQIEVDQDMRDAQVSIIPVGRAEACAKAIVKSACRGEKYLTEPSWFRVTYLWKVLCPEVIEWCFRLFYLARPGESETLSKKILDISGARGFLYPTTIQTTDVKAD
ncbi:unnamed protein product, partial [Vitis vinifera]|uniref:11-beta-hydroxysteroid dehydrogenase 1B n=1 Tax=Vitis vinifera TaxID=29760 RepID=D7SH18_VITVI